MYRAAISGIGAYLPTGRMTNEDLKRLISLEDEWIVSRTGIRERRISGVSEATSDLAYLAALDALDDAGILASEIDLILVATETPDHILPPVACQIQRQLGCRPIGAMDVHSTCVGFLSALQIADQYIKAGMHRCILVIGADTLSKLTDYSDPYTSILFGDAAGAVIVSRMKDNDEGEIISTSLHADGVAFEFLYVPGGGSRHPASEEYKSKMVMDGGKIFKAAVKAMTSGAEEILERSGYRIDQVDWFIPHQANERIIDAVARNLHFPEEKVVKTIHNYGNSCSATIPVSFHEAVRDGRIRHGDTILMTAFGAGLVWGAALIKY
ncbi:MULTISPECIES: beta-ketoacyl-ACP synthase III [Paenibacillus]|uniref:beta-ketoacyl-ACP synthase III n=1 Tax=Paenibacillus TaxID=44249 RepID=UPI00088CBC1A|nr:MULTISPECIES: beta-ketoacyl-ACP synthase III [Paenibacillus]NTZ19305.1 ketoacyl-ACP synthase III [Paenibacillus sp. JMULE4]SDJ72120.1 3-oxoacyl-[acyl-carrier-protein] synthase-3 [Paenibacillus naphthalenovorans]